MTLYCNGLPLVASCHCPLVNEIGIAPLCVIGPLLLLEIPIHSISQVIPVPPLLLLLGPEYLCHEAGEEP